MAGIHDGHRERLRNRVRKNGLDSLEEHEKLEYLLYSFVPRRDTNEIAHALLAAFGNIRGVMDADESQLLSIKGMTANAALFLKTLPDFLSSYLLSGKGDTMTSTQDCIEYFIAKIGRKKEEHFLTIYLDEAGHILKVEDITTGMRRSVTVDRNKIVESAVKCGAKHVAIGHNHPNGMISPSDVDIEATNRIIQALGVINIDLVDHVIVSGGAYYSMRFQGDLVAPVNLEGSVYQFAESLLRRENNINRLRFPGRKTDS